MGKALLINPSYFRTYGSNEGGLVFPVFPVLGLAALAGAVRARGHEATILDLSYRAYDPDLLREVIAAERPDVVGVTATTPLANQLRDISYLAKDVSSSILTVGGGAHPSALPGQTMRQSALDVVCTGEADHAIADLLDGVAPAAIGGALWRDGEAVVANPQGPLIENLDTLPIPDWEHYPLEGSRRVTRLVARHRPVTTVEFSRGCLYRCDFCGSKNTMGLGYRKKSPARCAEELALLQHLGYREAVITDDIFTSDNQWAAAVCEEIIRRRIDIAWTCSNGIRVDSATDELFTLMKRAGCYRVYFGFESGSDEVLRAFGKGGRATLDQGVDAVQRARRAGLEPNGFFLVGLSADTEATMQDTIDYARRVELDAMKCGICVPFPGTPMFTALHAEGRIKTLDWDAYTVYNSADRIFDHPTLEWPAILRAFKRFYRQAFLLNPAYIWRRLRFMLRNHEIALTVFYTIKFLLLLGGRGRQRDHERYAFEHRWRPLDLALDEPIEAPVVPRAGKGGGPERRDGAVTVVVGSARKVD